MLQVARDRLQLIAIHFGFFLIDTVIEVIVNQCPFGIGHRFLHRLHLLGDIQAGLAVFNHLDHSPKMPSGSLQPGNQGRMGRMGMDICHANKVSPQGGCSNSNLPTQWSIVVLMKKRLKARQDKQWRRICAVVVCFSIALWAVMPIPPHVPSVLETIQEHTAFIAEHGHSHGFKEDLAAAMHGHGHAHDAVGHDHSVATLSLEPRFHTMLQTDSFAQSPSIDEPSGNKYRIERPPRV